MGKDGKSHRENNSIKMKQINQSNNEEENKYNKIM